MMAASYLVTMQQVLTLVETLDATAVPGATAENRTITHADLNNFAVLDAYSTIAASKAVATKITLSGGAATVDLTALTGTNGVAVTFSGLKLQAMLFVNPVGNNACRIVTGASNGYNVGGVSTFSVTLPGGANGKPASALLFWPGTNGAVGGSSKTFDLAGTGTESVYLVMVAG